MRSARLASRRLTQTLRCFRNGLEIVVKISAGPAIFPALTFSTRNGLLIRCPNHPGARVPVYEVFAEDAYRLTGLVAAWGAEPHVLDIGGHIGCFSLQVAHAHRAATVTAYEASPTTASWLSHNVELNGLAHRITVRRVAVDGRAGLLKIMDNGHGSSLTGQTNSSPGRGDGPGDLASAGWIGRFSCTCQDRYRGR